MHKEKNYADRPKWGGGSGAARNSQGCGRDQFLKTKTETKTGGPETKTETKTNVATKL